MQKFKKPISILLVFMMIVSVFAVVPISAGAETMDWTYTITTGGEYTCPSTLTSYVTVSGGTQDNPVIIKIDGNVATNLQSNTSVFYIKSGYVEIIGYNDASVPCDCFIMSTINSSYRPTDNVHLSVQDVVVTAKNSTSLNFVNIISGNYKCTTNFENVTFKNCNVNGSGAVVIGSETTHTFKNCTFEDNTGYGAGGISVRNSSDVTMEGCTFKNCTRTSTTTLHGGGAVWVEENTKLTLDDCTFEDCTGKYGAVGIESEAKLTLKGNTTITGNQDGNLYLPSGATVKVDDDFSGTVGVTTQTAPTDSASVTLAGDLADTQSALANKNIVSDNANYAVRYDSNKLLLVVPATYTVTWKNGDDVLKTEQVKEGTTPTYDGAAPTKADDAPYTYTFIGWSDGENTYAANDFPAVNADVTYTAQFDKMIWSYDLSDGLVLDEGVTIKFTCSYFERDGVTIYEPFALAVCLNDEPVKNVLKLFSSNQEPDRYYKTTQKCIVDSYDEYKLDLDDGNFYWHYLSLKSLPIATVTWNNWDGSELETDNDVDFGTTPTYDGATPEKEGYIFTGWTDGENTYGPDDVLPKVTGDVTYTAVLTYIGTRVVGHSLSLDGDVGINFYMELSDAVANSSTAKVRFTIPKNGEPDTQDVSIADARRVRIGDTICHVFKCQFF